jgi:TrmH family RNA methyltransferase
VSISYGAAKYLRSLGRKKGRRERESFIVEGLRSLEEAASSTFEILEVYFTAAALEHPDGAALLDRLRMRTQTVREVSHRELRAMGDTENSQGIVAVVRQKRVEASELIEAGGTDAVYVALDAVSDPGNLGSIIRTCDWFGVNGLLIGDGSVELYNPKVIRSTMGGIFHLPIAQKIDLAAAVSRARDAGFRVYVTDAAGETHFDRVTYDRRSVIVFGNEARGVSDHVRAMADVRLTIRKYGAAESLNVGVACGIVLSALHRLSAE